MSNATRVIKSRFEIEQDGQSSYLEFETDGHGWMTIWHTEVAKELRGKGIGLELVTTAFQYAKENSLRVDVIAPSPNTSSKNTLSSSHSLEANRETGHRDTAGHSFRTLSARDLPDTLEVR